MTRASSLGTLAGALALLIASIASAQEEPRDRMLEERARYAYASKQYAEAARLFEASDRAIPKFERRVDASKAWEHAGDLARAADALAAALTLPSIEDGTARATRRHLDELEAQIGRVEVDEPAGASVGIEGGEARPVPTILHVAPGQAFVVVTTAEGRILMRQVSVKAGELTSVVVAPKVAPPAPAISVAPPVAVPLAPSAPPPASRSLDAPTYAPAIAVGATSAVFAGAAIALGVATVHRFDDFHATNDADSGLRRGAVTLRTLTEIAAACAGAGAAAGLYLTLRPPRAAPSRTPALALRASGAALLVPFF